MSNSNDPKSKEAEDDRAEDRGADDGHAGDEVNAPVPDGDAAQDADAPSPRVPDLRAPVADPRIDGARYSTAAKPIGPADTAADDSPDDTPGDAETVPEVAPTAADPSVMPDPEAEDAPAEANPFERTGAEAAPLGSAAPPERVVEKVVERRGGFWPVVFGGVVAAGLGFGAAYYLNLDDTFETETRSALDAQSGEIAGLSGKLATLSDETGARLDALAAEISATRDRIATAEDTLSTLGDRVAANESLRPDLAALDERLSDLAKRPIADTVSREAIKAYEDELERLRASMEQQRKAIEETIAAEKAKIEKIAADATQIEERALEQSRVAAGRSAVTRVLNALETGGSFEEPLAELAASVDAPMEALRAAAAEGVVTQAELRERFPDAARSALRAVRDGTPAGEGGGIGSVLEKMFEVRSVAPREGSDPDAVLSRAEAAVRKGELATALSEIEALPDLARDALADWVSDAQTRLAALEEAQAIAARLNQG